MSNESDPAVEIRVEIDSRIHFALQQNDVPVVKTVSISNNRDAPIRDLEVRISTEPAFAAGWSTRIASIAPGAIHSLDAIDLQLSPSFLSELTERMRGNLRSEVRCSGELLTSQVVPVELLARDEWGGLSTLPEILSAYVLPNHPAVDHVLRMSASILESWNGDPSLGGYQSKDPRRTYTMTAAIYAALQKVGITYVNPPASFEKEGQRIRLPDQILESRMATCLDIALFAASCLEQAGLNALIVLVEGHAFSGVWLNDECFPEPAVDDGLRLHKRVHLSELAVFDPTGVTNRPPFGFERAVTEARQRLASPESFLCAIDVQRSRKGQIRPLPERVARRSGQADVEPDKAPQREPSAPDVSSIVVSSENGESQDVSTAETPATRLDRWRRKLLDLSLRNRLLNFRETKKTLKLLCPDLGLLEDMLAGGAVFRVLPNPDDLGARDPRDAAAHQRRTGQEAIDALLLEELKSKRLHVSSTREELDRRLTEIYRAARVGLEEGGASALYLAVGFMSWYETEKSEKKRLAPILLLPLEIHRKSVRSGFTLRLSDDEARINVTLLQLLRQDHGIAIDGLDPLPEDDSGLDVPLILRTVRLAIRDVDRWDVIEAAQIGFFSFTKFLMWRDLNERAGDLMKNAVVEHLVNRPEQPFDPDGVFPRAERLDDEYSPTDTYCPLPADSSQLAAIFAASKGRSFVLEGPPGTGKSQTITNLIAHCLAEGKTVLFVSEKMAALNVVHGRLVGVGLGRYCLELHSNKARKREVIDQLGESLERAQALSEDEWKGEAHKLAGLRNELNAYVNALHAKRSTGETVFQATSRLIGLRDTRRVELRWIRPDSIDARGLATMRDVVEELATAASTCGEVRSHAWTGVRKADWTPGWQDGAHRAIEILERAVNSLIESCRACSAKLGFAESGWALDELDLILDVTRVLMASPAPPTALIVRPDWDEIQSQVTSWIEHGRARDRLRAEVRRNFRDEIIDLDLEDLQERLERAAASWWPASWWRRRPVSKAFKSASIEGKAPRTEDIRGELDRALALRNEQRKLDGASDGAREILGRYWKDGEAEWDDLDRVRDWAHELRSLALRAAGDDFERGSALRQQWAQLCNEGRELLSPDGSLGREFIAYSEALSAFDAARREACELLDLDVEQVWGTDAEPDALSGIRASTGRWLASFHQLRDWCAWRRARSRAMSLDLAPLIEEYESGVFDSAQLRPVFERSFTQWWLAAVTDREPVLSQFFSPEHERKIEQFRAIDERYTQLTRLLVEARLTQRVPATNTSVLPNSEMGVLKREVGKKRRHLSVRQLLRKIPNLLPRLKPCLLMSPMSVAQYLDADYPPFDIVVFDEASQIPVWDAVGAIARGRQSVIVGDPKQLPPTSFFQRSEDEEEGETEEVVEDLESILDDCIGAQVPWLPLDWHYRSRHESLITFSNYHYYGNRLLTFPSPAIEGMGVSWRHVPNGVYDKGKTRTNRAEADAVVEEVIARLGDSDRVQQTIGIVTFSQAQQTLIEDLLDAARAEDADLDEYFAEDREEPVFVKNLENVQGDERDVILFSICYGPDPLGKVSMNLGPMNREGGERRLNVAVTRARREVVVFSTLRADQIDLSRTRARGVRDLKGFLEYAERGPEAIAEATRPDLDADFDSPFEEMVFDALVQKGWEVHKQVGCARYRIDLAVVDPDARGRYLLGIECDGANYHRAKSARDRDKLREGVLRDLGWTLHRIWSTDWWTDPQREISKVEVALDQARRAGPRDSPATARASQDSHESDGVSRFADQSESSPAPQRAQPSALARYQPVAMDLRLGNQEDFYDANAEHDIRRRLVETVWQEGPISLGLAARRVAAAWGFERVRSRAIDRVSRLIPNRKVCIQRAGDDCFLWPIGMAPEEYDVFRVPNDDGSGSRSAEDIPREEIANAILHLLEVHVSAPEPELIREAARLFGFQRVGRIVEDRVRLGLRLLVQLGKVRLSGGSVAISR